MVTNTADTSIIAEATKITTEAKTSPQSFEIPAADAAGLPIA
jgi:hypothetical protein